MWAETRAWGFGLLLLGIAAACGQTNTTESGETHFLLTCSSQTCGTGLECLCGVCSRPCDDDAACVDLGRSISCVEHDASQCQTVTKACDATCARDTDCSSLGAGHTCRAGACRAGSRQACDSGCGGAECAAPGACSLETACALVDCGGVLVDDNACVRPSCESDDTCPTDQRCTSMWLSHHTACTESNETCDCQAGLGLFPVHVCSPTSLAGPRGAWVSLQLSEGGYREEPFNTTYTISPDGRFERTATVGLSGNPPQTSNGQLSAVDLEQLERSVNGPAVRAALADGTQCAPAGDYARRVTLELDTTTLDKDVSGCVITGGSAYDELFDLIDQY